MITSEITTLDDGRVFPLYEGEVLSWSLGLYNTLDEERAGYPRMRAVIRATRDLRPTELGREVRELIQASFGMFGPSAERVLRVMHEVLVVESEDSTEGENMAERFVRHRASAVAFGLSVPREGIANWHESGAVVEFEDGSAAYTLPGEFPGHCGAAVNVDAARRDYRLSWRL